MAQKVSLPDVVEFEWDEGNLSHIKKHDVEPKEAESVFYNRSVFFFDEKHSLQEDRYLAYGVNDLGRKLTIVFTFRKGRVRVISARDQSRKEGVVYSATRGNGKGGDRN